MRYLLLLLILLVISCGNWVYGTPPPPDEDVVTKRLNRATETLVKEILERMNTAELWEQPNAWDKVDLLVEYKDAAFPLIFQTLERETARAAPEWADNDRADWSPRTPWGLRHRQLSAFFYVFGKTKNAESLRYLCEFMRSLPKSMDAETELSISAVRYAQRAIDEITDGKVAFISCLNKNKRWFAEMADQADKWLAETKKPAMETHLPEIKEMLDKLEKNPMGFFNMEPTHWSTIPDRIDMVTRKCQLLIDNHYAALPLMLERLKTGKVSVIGMTGYFIVFEKTRALESIPYIADYLAALSEDDAEIARWRWAILKPRWLSLFDSFWNDNFINFPYMFPDEFRSFFRTRRPGMVAGLRKWYEEYKAPGAVNVSALDVLNLSDASNKSDLALQLQYDQVIRIIDDIETSPYSKRFLGSPSGWIASGTSVFSDVLAQSTELRSLIANPDIALPFMFKRFEKLPPDPLSLILYFIVFEHVKSAESIPYIADYLASAPERKEDASSGYVTDKGTPIRVSTWAGGMLDTRAYALQAAMEITRPAGVKGTDFFFGQQLNTPDKLKQWYKEYKKNQKKK